MQTSVSMTWAAWRKAPNPKIQAPHKLQIPNVLGELGSARGFDNGTLWNSEGLRERGASLPVRKFTISRLRFQSRLLLFQGRKVSFFAAGHEAFRDGFQLLPARADLLRFFKRDLVISCRAGDHRQQIGKFL